MLAMQAMSTTAFYHAKKKKKNSTLNYSLLNKMLQGFQFFWLSVFLLVMWLARWRALLVAIVRLAGIFCVIFTPPKCNCNNEKLYLSIILIMSWYKSLVNLWGLSAVYKEKQPIEEREDDEISRNILCNIYPQNVIATMKSCTLVSSKLCSNINHSNK